MNRHAATFEDYYERSDDPWGFRSRWYEKRKRALLRAILPREHYEAAWEIGCSNGELAAALAPACGQLLATDGNATATGIAAECLRSFPNARVERMWVPDQWPGETFDLVVLSEMAYYLEPGALEDLCRKLENTLRSHGHFLACHWRPAIEGCTITGNDAHEIMTRVLPWPKVIRHCEDDFVVDVWANGGQSVAEIEGLR